MWETTAVPTRARDSVGMVWRSVCQASARYQALVKDLYIRFVNWFEKYVIVFVLGGFVAGILGAKVSPSFGNFVDRVIAGFIDGYGFVAPVAIFIILTPALARMFKTRELGSFGIYVIKWYAVRKVLACVWAIAFIALVLRLPITPEGSASVWAAMSQSLRSLGSMALTSPYFGAMYASIIVALISLRVSVAFRVFDSALSGIESGGRYFIPVMPIFMVAIGAYIYGLPTNVPEQIGLEAAGGTQILHTLNIWGWELDPKVSTGMIMIYVVGSLLTAIACMMWQFTLLAITARKEKRFTIKGYFRDYWIKVYPLLWSTSSEALATPLNLYLVKRYSPYVRSSVRRFIVGIGSYMNINGTLINVIILGAIVLVMLGFNVSVIELLLIIPIVFLISYGVPGIPGELVLFAGPIALLLNLPEEITPTFLALYIGLQIGLPDSFRTGSNSTDDQIAAILMNRVYEDRFLIRQPHVDQEPD